MDRNVSSTLHEIATPMTRRITKCLTVLSCLFLLLLVPLSSYGSENSSQEAGRVRHKRAKPDTKLYGPAAPQELDGGIWRTEDGFQATLRISSVVKTAAIKVTPVLFMADGTEYVLPAINLKASGSAMVNINDALNNAPAEIAAHLSNFGAAALRFQWPWPSAINASVRSLDVKRSLIFNNSLQTSLVTDMNFRKTRFASARKADAKQPLPVDTTRRQIAIEGLWWKHDPEEGGFVTLTNRSQEQIPAQVTIFGPGQKEKSSTHLLLLPRETRRLGLKTAIDDFETGVSGAISVRYEGVKGSILVTGGMENAALGYSAKIPFAHVPAEEHPLTWTLASVGIMHGPPDSVMQFPANTRFSAYAVLRNTSSQPLQVTPTLYFTPGREAKTPETPVQAMKVPALTLKPGEIRNLDVEGALAGSGLKDVGGSVTLSLDMNGIAGALLAAIGSVDQSGSYVFEVSPHMVSSSLSKSVCFFEVGGGDDTMVSLWNHSEREEDLLVTLFYNDGHYKLPLHLAPKQSAMFNVVQIIKAQSPDADGNTIPLSTRHGSILVSGPQDATDTIDVTVNAATFSVRNATCGENCVMCWGYTNFVFDVENASLNVGDVVTLHAMQVYADGEEYYIDAQNWDSSDWGMMYVDQGGNVTGQSPGQGWIYADTTIQIQDVACIDVWPYSECPIMADVGGGGLVTVKPKITGMSPSTLLIGLATTVEIDGQGFSGPFLSVNPGPNYTATPTVLSDSRIVAVLTPLASASGPQSLTVTVNGQTSNAVTFQVVALQGTLTPVDNFAGRSNALFGIAEVVNLSFSTSPPATAASLGGLQWTLVSGGGTLTAGADGTGTYTAPSTPSAVVLRLAIASGFAQNQGSNYNLTVIAPSGAHIVKNSNLRHTMGLAGVGFQGDIFLEPASVSFARITFGEGTNNAVASGFYASLNGIPHPQDTFAGVGNCSAATGCLVTPKDQINSGDAPPPFAPGDFLWVIPWQYFVGAGPRTAFTTANHHQFADATGKVSIEKKGAGPFSRNANDPTSSY